MQFLKLGAKGVKHPLWRIMSNILELSPLPPLVEDSKIMAIYGFSIKWIIVYSTSHDVAYAVQNYFKLPAF